MNNSIFTYLATKTVNTRKAANALAFALTYEGQPKVTVTRLSGRAWRVEAWIPDTMLETAQSYLQTGYGLQTFTTN